MYVCPDAKPGTLRQLDSSNGFLCIKSKAFTRLFFGTINKSGIIPLFISLGGLYSLFSSSRHPMIRLMPDNGIQYASTTKRDMFISLKYNTPELLGLYSFHAVDNY